MLAAAFLINPLLAIGCPMGGCWTAPPEQATIDSGNCCRPSSPGMTANGSCCCEDPASSSVLSVDAKAAGDKTTLLNPEKRYSDDHGISRQSDVAGATFTASSAEYQGNRKTPLYLVNASFLI